LTIVEGAKAPELTLHDAEGRTVSLEDFAGRDVIVYFYPEDDTPGCTKEACAFRDLWEEIRGANAVVLGVSPDGGESHRRFAAKYELPFPLLSDPDRKIMEAYGAWGGERVIRSTVWIGPDGKVVRHWRRVSDAAGHPTEILEALRARA